MYRLSSNQAQDQGGIGLVRQNSESKKLKEQGAKIIELSQAKSLAMEKCQYGVAPMPSSSSGRPLH